MNKKERLEIVMEIIHTACIIAATIALVALVYCGIPVFD